MTQIDFSDLMMTKIDRQVPLLGGGSQSGWIAAQSFGYPKDMTAIEKLSFGLDLTHDIARGVWVRASSASSFPRRCKALWKYAKPWWRWRERSRPSAKMQLPGCI
ncbi:MAG: hypothetical protein ACR2G5_12990 [Pyrinomonadaceae bacterium]